MPLTKGYSMGVPRRRAKARKRSGGSCWSRKKMTRWSSSARRIAATVPESSSDARLMPWISAPSAPAIGLTSSAAIARSMSLEIRLLARMRFGEGRNAHASVVDAHHALVGLNWALEQLRRRHLRDEADVRDRRAVAVAEPAGGILFGEELFHCLEAGAEPMLDPCRFRGLVDLEDVRQVIADARHDERMRIRDIDQREAAHPGARQRIGRQDRRFRVFLFEIFEDGDRLEELGVAVEQGRHDRLRVRRLVFRLELIAAIEVDEDFLALQSLEIERDADAERRLRPPIGVDLHPIPPSLFDWCGLPSVALRTDGVEAPLAGVIGGSHFRCFAVGTRILRSLAALRPMIAALSSLVRPLALLMKPTGSGSAMSKG